MKAEKTGGGEGGVFEFRESVLKTALEMVRKNGGTLDQHVGFILEECAYACSYFQNINMVYPVPSMPSMVSVFERYKLNVRQLTYKLSRYMEQHKHDAELFEESIKDKIFEFLTEKMTNVNFFIINKKGEQIYKNYALDREIGEINAKNMPEPIWENSIKVMKTGKQFTFEEKHKDRYYLSVKAPLIIRNKTEGLIGLAIDITDRKINGQLERENKLQQAKIDVQNKIKDIFEKFVVSVSSTMTELSATVENNKKLTEEERLNITCKMAGIKSIIKELLLSLKENGFERLGLD